MHEGKNKINILIILLVIFLASLGLSILQPEGINIFWVAIAIKLSLLIVMFGLLVNLFLGMIVSVKKHKALKKSQIRASRKRAVVHVIRKTPKKRTRTIKK